MKHLYLIRHAKSSWDHPGLHDFDRPLNRRGLRVAPQMAQLLVSEGDRPDLILSSPAKRAYTTALFFAEAFGIPESEVVTDERIYEASVRTLLRVISELPDAAGVVYMFGHNPGFTQTINLYSAQYLDNLPTCGVAHLRSEAAAWNALYEGNTAKVRHFFPRERLQDVD